MDISSNHMFQHETHDNVEIKNELHCVLDCAFWEQKKFLTKAGSEPGPTRASSGGC